MYSMVIKREVALQCITFAAGVLNLGPVKS